MASTIGKRKREEARNRAKPSKKVAILTTDNAKESPSAVKPRRSEPQDGIRAARSSATGSTNQHPPNDQAHIQIITGSYERVLHGICASIPLSALGKTSGNSPATPLPTSPTLATDDAGTVTFSDTFLLAAHASSIRCLAISPPTEQQSDKRYLATGGSDERINVYSLSTVPPGPETTRSTPSLNSSVTAENPHNRSLGSLVHHDRAITCLHFPVRSKLVSAAEDATISISRTRDWTVLSSIKAPIPKPQGRPSGDTAAPGEVPAGVNDFAIHPSQRLMLSVGRGERCVRLWNLMTGKKAGVLNFDRELLMQVGKGKFSTGEGRRLLWDARGENYVVGFERGAAVFGIDSKPKAVIKPSPQTKIHQMRLVPSQSEEDVSVLAVSTEDGRILFYNIDGTEVSTGSASLPYCDCLAQLGGRAVGIAGRVKDFEIFRLKETVAGASSPLLVVTGNSDGAVRLWITPDKSLSPAQLLSRQSKESNSIAVPQVGQLIGTLETGVRITCLGAFPLDGTSNDRGLDESLLEGPENEEQSEEDEDSD